MFKVLVGLLLLWSGGAMYLDGLFCLALQEQFLLPFSEICAGALLSITSFQLLDQATKKLDS